MFARLAALASFRPALEVDTGMPLSHLSKVQEAIPGRVVLGRAILEAVGRSGVDGWVGGSALEDRWKVDVMRHRVSGAITGVGERVDEEGFCRIGYAIHYAAHHPFLCAHGDLAEE